jgi:biotin-dependent carboxylase-like uncharacterized protein
MLQVTEAGLETTIQDGKPRQLAHLGAPSGGASDWWSLVVANLLVGNHADDAAIEMTIVGPQFAVLRTCVVGIAGADLGAVVPEEGRRLAPGSSYLLHAGTSLRFGGGTDGARAYLAIAGAVDVPAVLGSRGTCLPGWFGGMEGRALRAGDLLAPMRAWDPSTAGRAWPDRTWRPAHGPIRLLPGPPTLSRPATGAFDALVATTWVVAPSSNRVGVRLEGQAIEVDAQTAGRLVSRGTVPGSVQIVPGGQPIVLFVDSPTTGGYPIGGVVATADLPVVGQLGPGDPVQFVATSLDDARAALVGQQRMLTRAKELFGPTRA